MDKYSFLNAAHTAFFADLYDRYLVNPDSVEPSWRAFFQGFDFGQEFSSATLTGSELPQMGGLSESVPDSIRKEFMVVKLIDAYRSRGHLFTKTNPVRARRTYEPTLDIENFGLSAADLDTVFSAGEILGLQATSAQYCSSLASDLLPIYRC